MNTTQTQTQTHIISDTAILSSVSFEERLFSKEQYLTFRTAFKKLATAKQITSSDIVLYNILRQNPTNRGFTPITNRIKIVNGQHPRGAFINACYMLRRDVKHEWLNERFDGFIQTEEEKTVIIKMITKSLNELTQTSI